MYISSALYFFIVLSTGWSSSWIVVTFCRIVAPVFVLILWMIISTSPDSAALCSLPCSSCSRNELLLASMILNL